MVKFSSDVDILKYEPLLFGELHLPWQVLVSGTSATLEGTTLTAPDADFVAASIGPGAVMHLSTPDGALDGAYEVISADSATQLTLSVLRSDSSESPIAPAEGSDITYRVSTFGPQAAEVAFQLTEYFGIQPGDPTSAITVASIVDTEVLRRASVFAVISSIYAMWASRTEGSDLWRKSLHYRQLFEKARQRCRLSVDLGADGVADFVRTGSAIRLVRD